MAIVVESGTLLNVGGLDFVNDKGEEVKGIRVTLLRPARDPKYEGYGMYTYKLVSMGREAFDLLPSYLAQAKGLFMRYVDVECELVFSGSKPRLIPLSISAASKSE